MYLMLHCIEVGGSGIVYVIIRCSIWYVMLNKR